MSCRGLGPDLFSGPLGWVGKQKDINEVTIFALAREAELEESSMCPICHLYMRNLGPEAKSPSKNPEQGKD